MRARARKLATTIASVAMLGTMLFASSASVSTGIDGDHTVTICHVTHSATNPYVIIEVDVAAFDGAGDNDHTTHTSPTGLMDVLYDEINGCYGGGST